MSGKTDKLFDALVSELGIENVSDIDRGRLNAACKSLRQKHATAEQVHQRCDMYRFRWPKVALTAHALAANWDNVKPPPERPDRAIGRLFDAWMRERPGHVTDLTYEGWQYVWLHLHGKELPEELKAHARELYDRYGSIHGSIMDGHASVDVMEALKVCEPSS